MAMKAEKTMIYVSLLPFLLCILNTTASKAIPLITVKEDQRNGDVKFLLNPEAISMIKQLSSPIKVIAAIGDARVGKSTALNFIHHTLSNAGLFTGNPKEIFITGNTMAPATRGVWISTVQSPRNDGMENVILLDVEGTDVGDNTAVTDKLSMFATMLSSGLLLFMKDNPTNHINEFMYKIARMNDILFSGEDTKYLPHLLVISRGALAPPPGYSTTEDYVKEQLLIKSQVQKRGMTVVDLPFDLTLNSFDYKEKIINLTKKVMRLPRTKLSETGTWEKIKDTAMKWLTDRDNEMHGHAVVDLVKKFVKILNEQYASKERINHNFNDLFDAEICTKTFNDEIKPIMHTATQERESRLGQFKKKCRFLKQRVETAIDILEYCNTKDDQKCHCDQWNNLSYFHWCMQVLGMVVFTGIILIVSCYTVRSDVRLKNNITLMNTSEYETIGLRGVEWVWNRDAERLGLSGKGSGVVAQEVELLYSWAVTEGYDGYKRVDYPALRLMIWAKKFQQKAKDLINIMNVWDLVKKS